MSETEQEPTPAEEPELDEEAVRELDDAGEQEPALDEPEQEPEQEPAEARAPSDAELRAFERENTRHEKALAKLIGDDWQAFGPCEHCGGVGFTPGGLDYAPELAAMPGVIECPGCKGYGRLTTPSRVPGQETQVCVDCAGMGWKHEAARSAEPAPAATAIAPNGGTGAPTGYILVKVDPNAPDLPPTPPTQAAPAPVAAP